MAKEQKSEEKIEGVASTTEAEETQEDTNEKAPSSIQEMFEEKQIEKHRKFLKGNLEKAHKLWQKTLKKMEGLGYKVNPTISQVAIKGLYAATIELRGMSIEEWDRKKNPKKWLKIDEERAKAAEEARDRAIAEAEEKTKAEKAKKKSKKK